MSLPPRSKIPPEIPSPIPLESPHENGVEGWGWTRAHRLSFALLLTCLLAFLIIQYIRRPYRLDDAVTLQHGAVPELETTLDPNTADARSLARISLLSEKIAQAIVDYREFHQDDHGITFQNLDDLGHVHGISKKNLPLLRPYLRFPGDATQPAPAPHGLIPPTLLPDETQPTDPTESQPQ